MLELRLKIASTIWNRRQITWKLHQQLVRGINCSNGNWWWRLMLLLAWRLISVGSNLDFWHHVNVFFRELMRTIWLGQLIYLLSAVCAIYRNGIYWTILINIHNINGDINGMLTYLDHFHYQFFIILFCVVLAFVEKWSCNSVLVIIVFLMLWQSRNFFRGTSWSGK